MSITRDEYEQLQRVHDFELAFIASDYSRSKALRAAARKELKRRNNR